jgi:hypothetical protein
MGSFVARAVLYLIFGFFIYEIINEFNKLFGLSLNPYCAIVPAGLVYVVQEFVIKKLKANEKVSISKPMKPKFDRVYYLIAWILVLVFFLVILVVWAGLICKQITENL